MGQYDASASGSDHQGGGIPHSVPALAGIVLVNAGAGALDVSGIILPAARALAEYRDRTGHRVEISERNNGLAIQSWGELTLDTEIERRGTTKTLRDWLAGLKAGAKMRCETPFRASVSEAAVLRSTADGNPVLHDVGSGITYHLEHARTSDDLMKTAYAVAGRVKRDGGSYEDMLAALGADPRTAEWLAEKGLANDQRVLKRMWPKLRDAPPAWLEKCQVGQDGTPRGTLSNALLALREDERLARLFRLDEMLRAVVTLGEDGTLRPATDVDVSRLQEWLQREGLETIIRSRHRPRTRRSDHALGRTALLLEAGTPVLHRGAVPYLHPCIQPDARPDPWLRCEPRL